jgi:hypothetical protein
MSIPLTICATTSAEDRSVNSTGTTTPLEQMCHFFSRGVADARSPWATYVQFIHDSYNADEEDELEGDGEAQQALEGYLGGNRIRALGVRNAPFLQRGDVGTPRARAEWVRYHRLQRHVEQTVPHFACSMVAWGLSMALSRTFADEEGELTFLPLIDLCNHSSNPNVNVFVATSEILKVHRLTAIKGKGTFGVPGCRGHERPHAHLYAARDIAAGDELTLLYDERGTSSDEDAEMWRLRYGFVPVS